MVWGATIAIDSKIVRIKLNFLVVRVSLNISSLLGFVDEWMLSWVCGIKGF